MVTNVTKEWLLGESGTDGANANVGITGVGSGAPKYHSIPSTTTFPAGGTGNPISIAIIADQKSAGTSGGTFTSGAWRTRDLNTKVSDPDGIVSISSNQFTLGAGTYIIDWTAPAYGVNKHKSSLYDITGSSYLTYGQVARSDSAGNGGMCMSHGSFIHAPSASNTYEIRHYCQTTLSSSGFGPAGGSDTGSTTEVYTLVTITKLK